MTRLIRTTALVTLMTLGGGLPITARPAQAQGPYGRNSYADVPFNQGSLFYQPLKPKPKPKVKVWKAPRPNVLPYTITQPGYTHTQPTVPQQHHYYYYPAPTYRR